MSWDQEVSEAEAKWVYDQSPFVYENLMSKLERYGIRRFREYILPVVTEWYQARKRSEDEFGWLRDLERPPTIHELDEEYSPVEEDDGTATSELAD